MRGCPTLKNAYFYGTSLTDVGVRTLVASKLVASLKAVGVSSHVTKVKLVAHMSLLLKSPKC